MDEAMWARKIGELSLTVLIRAVLVLVLIALAVVVLGLGIAWMRVEPQGIVALGTLGLTGLLLWLAFTVAFARESDGDEAPEEAKTAGSS